jgi:WD40 repeat protein
MLAWRLRSVLAALVLLPPALSAAEPVRVDRYGDPLPEGAVARFGTVRWRHGNPVNQVGFDSTGNIWSLETEVESRGFRGFPHVFINTWDRQSGRLLRRVKGPDAIGARLIQTPEGPRVFWQHYENGIQVFSVWDVSKSKESIRLSLPKDQHYQRLSPDGRLVVTVETDDAGIAKNAMMVWDLTSGQCCSSVKLPEGSSFCQGFTPDGSAFLTAGTGAAVQLWDSKTGRQLRSFGLPNRDKSPIAALSPDGQRVALSAAGGRLQLWNASDGKIAQEFTGQENQAGALTFSPDGSVLATSDKGNIIRLFDVATGGEKSHFSADQLSSLQLVFSPDGELLAGMANSPSLAETILLWDVRTQKALHVPAESIWRIGKVMFSESGRLLIAGNGFSEPLVWNRVNGERQQLFAGHRYAVVGLAVSNDGKRLATGSSTKTVKIWDTASGREIGNAPVSENYVHSLAFAPSGGYLALINYESQFHLWDIAKNEEIRAAPSFGQAPLNRLEYSPTRDLIAAECRDWIIRFWEPLTGFARGELTGPPGGGLTVPAFTHDGRVLACCSLGDDASVILWDVATLKERARLPAPQTRLARICFSRDGRLMITSGFDKMIRAWDVATNNQLHVWEGHRGIAHGAALTPDGSLLATGSDDTTILLWDVAAVLAQLPKEGPALTAADLASLWTDLASDAAAKAHKAIWKLALSPKESIPFLQKHVKPVAAPDAGKISKLIADLDNPQFAVREAAVKELDQLEDTAAPALKKALENTPSAEAKKRIEQLLQKREQAIPSGEGLRLLRVIETLEHAATPEARQLLGELAHGLAEARATRDAKESLERLHRKSK